MGRSKLKLLGSDSEIEPEKGYIMALPEEVRGVIYNKLTQKEALNLRLVCRTWRNELDIFYDFKIRLDEKSPYLDWILQLRVKECKVIKFVKEPLAPNPARKTIFKHPVVIRSINVDTSDSFRSPLGTWGTRNNTDTISLVNLHSLLSSSAQYLDKLSLRLTMNLMNETFPNVRYPYNFENLKILIICIDFSVISSPSHLHPEEIPVNDVLNQLIVYSQTPKLKTISVSSMLPDAYNTSKTVSSILSCISKPRLRPLEVLNISLHSLQNLDNIPCESSDFEKMNPSLLKKVDSLKELKIDLTVGVAKEWWLELLVSQRKVEYVDIGNSCIPVPSYLFRQTVLNNWETLVSVDIMELEILAADNEGDRVFDMSVFQDCHNLQKLRLRRRRIEIANDSTETPYLINLFYLPLFMVELCLENFRILTDDLISFSSNPRDLQMLSLRYCGESSAFGITATVLERIMTFNSLTLMKLKQFNISDREEKSKLYSILPVPYDYRCRHEQLCQGFITLCRNSYDNTWENEGW